MHFVGTVLLWLCCVGVYGFARLIDVICMVYKCVFVLSVYIGRFEDLRTKMDVLMCVVAVWVL